MVEPGQEASRPSTHAICSPQGKSTALKTAFLARGKTLEVDFFKGALQKNRGSTPAQTAATGEMASTTRSEK